MIWGRKIVSVDARSGGGGVKHGDGVVVFRVPVKIRVIAHI